MAKKRKTLPADFDELLKDGDIEKLKAVFDGCLLDAVNSSQDKRTALSRGNCPDELSRWLVAQGADLHIVDENGKTPLHHRARSLEGRIAILVELGADVNAGAGQTGTPLHEAAKSNNPVNVERLLACGARPDTLLGRVSTPLDSLLQDQLFSPTTGRGPPATARIAQMLLEAGAAITSQSRGLMEKLGANYEMQRGGVGAHNLEAYDGAMQTLYALLGVPPAPRRVMHDGRSPIAVTGDRWEDRYGQLWDLLVPSGGPAATVQGEVVRLAGRIAHEIDGNGGINWSRDFAMMADAWLAHVGSRQPLSAAQLEEAARYVASAKERQGNLMALRELSVAWVTLNPTPEPLPPPAYKF